MHAGGAGDDITLASAASWLWENDKLFNELFITPAEYGSDNLFNCLVKYELRYGLAVLSLSEER